eukprot:scaffold713_cov274-Chaetoceros_neogracile.AAC.1
MESVNFVRAVVGLHSLSTGFLFPEIDMEFIFKVTPNVSKVQPNTGGYAGSTTVEISFELNSGILLNADAGKCRFGSSFVDVRWVSESKVVCLSPPRTNQPEVTLEFSDNGVDYVPAGTFRYFSPPLISAIFPWGGLITSRSNVQISLSHPLTINLGPSNMNIECLFRVVRGDRHINVAGKVYNSSMVHCPLPQFQDTGNVTVALSLNGDEFSESTLVYQVIEPIEITSMFPISGTVANKTTVRLQGNFSNLEVEWGCYLENNSIVSMGATTSISPNEIQCEVFCLSHTPGAFTLILKANGLDLSLRQPFMCDAAYEIQSIEPSILTTGTHHLVLVEGDNLRTGQHISCMFTHEFGVHRSKGKHVDSNKVACQTPIFQQEGIVQVTVSTNGQEYGKQNTILEVFSVPVVTKVGPSRIVAGEIILIEGTFGRFQSKIYCDIDGYPLVSYTLAEGKIACMVLPDIETGNHTMVLGIIGLSDGVIHGPSTLEVFGRPFVSSITPAQGLRLHSQSVVVSGANFSAQESIHCHFGLTVISGKFISDSEIICLSPESEESGYIQFRVQVGSRFAHDRFDISFLFMNAWVIDEIIPNSGGVEGGTDVSIFGRDFFEGVAVNCRFGELTVPATIHTESFAKCKSPHQEFPGYVDFQLEMQQSGNLISLPGHQMANLSQFYVYPTQSIIQFHPLAGFSHGGTVIFINGTWSLGSVSLDSYSPMCKFGSQIVKGVFTESRLISCRAPSTFGVGSTVVELSISLNEADFVSSPTTFQYYNAVYINAISPRRGQILGGTQVSLELLSGRIPDQKLKVSCRFGDFGGTPGNFDTFKNAITCSTPPMKEATSVSVYLKLGTMDSWYDTGKRFIFESNIILNHVSPRTLHEDGGEAVYVHGEGFNTMNLFHCCFGTFQVPARRVSSEILSCESPTFSEVKMKGYRSVILSITSNLVDKMQVPGFIRYETNYFIERVEPNIGPVSGASLVKIIGAGFQLDSPTLCWFGDYATTAKVLSKSMVTCYSSPFYLRQSIVEKAVVGVSQGDGSMIVGDMENISFGYFKHPLASDFLIHPTSIPLNSISEIQIGGLELSRLLGKMETESFLPDVKVRHQLSVLPAFLRDDKIVFQVPRDFWKNAPVRYELLELSFNGGANFSPGPFLEVYENPALVSVQPSSVISGYHSAIVVEVSNLHWFERSKQRLSCRIGSVITTGEMMSSTLVRCPLTIVMSHIQHLIPVSIALNAKDFIQDNVFLSVIEQPKIFETSSIPVSSSGNLVVLKGSNFESLKAGNIQIICVQDEVSIIPICCELQIMNGHIIRFDAPPGNGVAKLQLQVDSDTYFDTGVELQYLEDVVLETVRLKSDASQNESVILEVVGKHFDFSLEYSCVLSTESARKYSAQFFGFVDMLQCSIPRVRIELNSRIQIVRHIDNSYSNGLGMQLFYGMLYALQYLSPQVVAEGGNATIHIAKSFESKDSLFCRYYSPNKEEWTIPVLSVTSKIIECKTPSELSPGASSVFLSSRDNAYQSNALPFTVRVRQVIVNITPASAFMTGGTLLHAEFDKDIVMANENGSNEGLVCDFGGTKVLARIQESRVVVCETPTFPEAIVVPLKIQQISMDGKRYIPIHDNVEIVYFAFTKPPLIVDVIPRIGLTTGGTIADIYGINFSTSVEQNIVRLVSITNPSFTTTALVVKISDVGLKVTLPQSPEGLVEGGLVHLDVSTNGINFVRFLEPLRLILPELQLNIISPNVILEGSRLFITVYGSNFGESSLEKELSCRIGYRRTRLIWHSSSMIQCEYPQDFQIGAYNLSVVHGDPKEVHSSNFLSVIVKPKIFLIKAYPLFGAFRGGTNISLEGSGFLTVTETLIACSFDNEDVELIALNDTHATCTVPPIPRTRYSQNPKQVQVAFDIAVPDTNKMLNELKPDQKLTYTYYPDENILDIFPRLLSVSSAQKSFRIDGFGFVDTVELSCKVGQAKSMKAMYVNSTSIICPLPSPEFVAFGSREKYLKISDKGFQKFSVSVSNNGNYVNQIPSFQWASITFYEELRIESVHPPAGSKGTQLQIHVDNLPRVDTAFCAFANFIVVANIVHPSTIVCTCPTNPDIVVPNKVDLLVSVNEVDFVKAGSFTYLDEPIPYSVEPSFGPDIGGNTVMITGANFHEHIPLICLFGELKVLAMFVQPGLVSCVVPSHESETVQLSVLQVQRGQIDVVPIDYPTILFTYLKQMKPLQVTPSHGSRLGNTPLKILGEQLVSLDNLVCIFGDNFTTPAVLTRVDEVSCTAPDMRHAAHKFTLGISLGLQHNFGIVVLSKSGVLFTYTLPHTVIDVNPKRGLISGGESVMITGKDFARPQFDDNVLCSFGDNVFNGLWLSETLIQCITQRVRPENSWRAIQVIRVIDAMPDVNAWNEFHFSLTFENESTKPLNYSLDASEMKAALSILPNIGDIVVESTVGEAFGRLEKTFKVTFTTLGIPANAGPLPLLGVSFLSLAPRLEVSVEELHDTCCDVQISTNNVDFLGGELEMVPFTFDANLLVNEVYPSHGAITGGTLVKIKGSGISAPFAQSSSIYCIFGDKVRGVESKFLNSSFVECKSPPFPAPANVIVTLEVYAKAIGSGSRIESVAHFKYVSPPTITSAFPKSLSLPRSVTTHIDVFGEFFISTLSLKCRMKCTSNDKLFEQYAINVMETPAIYHNTSHIRCQIPNENAGLDHWGRALLLAVTTNGVDWTKDHSIPILQPHKVTSIYPSSGPRSGGTKIYIDGEYFIESDTLACKFGNIIAKGEFIIDEGIYCISPLSELAVSVQVRVTTNGEHFTTDDVIFDYYEDVAILSAHPMVAPSSGGTTVSLVLSLSTLSKNDYFCKFNDTQVPAKVQDDLSISCLVPPAHAKGGLVPLEVTRNRVDFSSSGITFMYLPGQQSESLSILPTHGPKAGGTLIQVSGYSNITKRSEWNLATPKCRFNDVIDDAISIVKEDESIICISPSFEDLDSISSVLVDISLTGGFEDFTSIGVLFQYDDDISVEKLVPDMGSLNGGTQVSVLGGPFLKCFEDTFTCRFGNDSIPMPAIWESEREISCVIPPLLNMYETQNLTLFGMAWNQEVQSVELSVQDYRREIHTISTHGIKYPMAETQVVQIEGKKDRFEVQRVTVGYKSVDSCHIDIAFTQRPRGHKIFKITTEVQDGHSLLGGFQILVREGRKNKLSNRLPHDASAERMKEVLMTVLDTPITEVSTRNYTETFDGTAEWTITFVADNEVPRILLKGNGLIGLGASIHIEEISEGFLSEIQRISIVSTHAVKGHFYVYFNGFQTTEVPWNASAKSLKEILERLPSIGTVKVHHKHANLDATNEHFRISWEVTFLSFDGDAPLMNPCCDSRNNPDSQSIFSDNQYDDVLITVEEVRRGQPNNEENFFQLSFSGFLTGVEDTTKAIAMNATEAEVFEAMSEVSIIKRQTLVVEKSFIDRENGYPRYGISFEPIVSHPILTPLGQGSVRFKMSPLSRNDGVISIKQDIAIKEVQTLEYRIGVGLISCNDERDGENVFSFHSESSSETLRNTMESFAYYGKVKVTKINIGSNTVRMIIIFDTDVYDRPSLACGPNVLVRTLVDGVERKVLGGSFQLLFGNAISKEILFNSTASDLKNALKDLRLSGEDSFDVSEDQDEYPNGCNSGSWLITFKGHDMNGDLDLFQPVNEKLLGHNSNIVVVEVEKGSFLTGTYRLKVKDFWSATIFVNATVSEIKASIEAISGVFVRVSNLERSTLGGIKFEITFLHYVGDEPFGFIPWTAGDLSPLVVDKENLKGCSFIITNIVKKIGTSPIDTSEDLKGFRLVPPGFSTTYPLAKVTRWLCHNESNSNMKEALLQTGGVEFDIDVSREGPFSNGSYKWHVTYPLGESSMGSSWGVVRNGGAAIQLLGHGAN